MMINTALSGPNRLFCVDPQKEHFYGILLARRLREHEVVRGVVGAHPLLGPDHLRRPGLADARPAFETVITQDILTCCSVSALLFFLLSQDGGWPWPRPAARVLTRFPQLSSPTYHGDVANPLLESAFSTHLVVSRFWFVSQRHCW